MPNHAIGRGASDTKSVKYSQEYSHKSFSGPHQNLLIMITFSRMRDSCGVAHARNTPVSVTQLVSAGYCGSAVDASGTVVTSHRLYLAVETFRFVNPIALSWVMQ
jgi:hypothetical protein